MLELVIVEQETYAVLQNKPINFKSEIVAVKKDTDLAEWLHLISALTIEYSPFSKRAGFMIALHN